MSTAAAAAAGNMTTGKQRRNGQQRSHSPRFFEEAGTAPSESHESSMSIRKRLSLFRKSGSSGDGSFSFKRWRTRATTEAPGDSPPSRNFAVPTGAKTSFADAVVEVSFSRSRSPIRPFKMKKESPRYTRFAACWVIDPRHSSLLGPWDALCILSLLFVALVTPFEVAFLESPRSADDIVLRFGSVGWLWCLNRLVDIIFTIDLVLQFRLMFKTSDTMQGAHALIRPAGPLPSHVMFAHSRHTCASPLHFCSFSPHLRLAPPLLLILATPAPRPSHRHTVG